MNHIYRSIRNEITGVVVTVSEHAKRGGKKTSGAKNAVVNSLAVTIALLFGSVSHAAPTGGTVVAGSASISSSANTTTVNQSSQNAALNWQSFDIGVSETVNFVQPNSSSVALNRVLGADPSSILGSLSANGKVFLVNPNGILFGTGAQVNVGGLVASTRNISDSDFMAGQYNFSGNSNAGILNQGAINADGGYVALLGANVSNQGVITAKLGSVTLAAGNAITLDVAGDGLLNVTVNAGAVDALVQNGGLIQANGGQVLLTARSAGSLLQSAVNNTGVIQAQTIENHNGVIKLLGDMQSGTVNSGGKLDASAPVGGNGGFIETSAAHVQIATDAIVTTAAPQGTTGQWLIDPVDFTIAVSGGDITGALLSTNLGASNIVIQSISGASGVNGDINVNDTVTWSANQLTLNAQNNINVNTAMNGSGTASLALVYGQGALAAGNTSTVNVRAPVNLPTGDNLSMKLGSDGAVVNYAVINDMTALQNINSNLGGNYALGSSLDATGVTGFVPIGPITSYDDAANQFSGTFDGLGHTISHLTINRPANNYVGMFGGLGGSGRINNIGLLDANVTGVYEVAALVSFNYGIVTNSFATGAVHGVGDVGGLIGYQRGGSVVGSYADVATTGTDWDATVGGLVADNEGGFIRNSYATGSVSGGNVGGLLGINRGGTVINSYATGSVISPNNVSAGGLIGNQYFTPTVTNSYWDITTSGQSGSSGGIGFTTAELQAALPAGFSSTIWGNGDNQTTPYLLNNPGRVLIATDTSATYYNVIRGLYQLQGLNANVAGNYVLGNDIDASATSSWNSGAGFAPIGSSTSPFTGRFDGLGHTITALTINLSTPNVGLFGYASAGAVIRNVGLNGGSVTGGAGTGGLVGNNTTGTISNSYSTINVIGAAGSGGLVGSNTSGSISNSYATGSVTGAAGTGGLVGSNTSGAISNSYATGSVAGAAGTGGLVGSSTSGPISNSYATGFVTSSGAGVGGLVGSTSGAVNNSFWDVTTSGQATSAGGTGLTTAQMQSASNFTGFNFTTTPGATGNNWVMVNFNGTLNSGGDASGGTRPMLASEYSTTIRNAHQLQLMRMNLAANYTLANNLQLGAELASPTGIWYGSSAGFAPIGVFNGSFDGLGHTIEGLLINRPADTYVGLFGAVGAAATVSNVGLVGGSVTGNIYVGSLAGRNEGTISNSFATTSVSGATSAGGLVGAVFSTGTLANSHAGGTVSSQYAGGLAGLNQGTISNSYATGAATGANSGGFVGRNVGGTVSNSYAIGAVTGASSGGFTSVNTGTINNSYTTSAVTGAGSGGFASVNVGTVTNSFWDTTSGQAASAGGTGLTTAELQASLPVGFSSTIWGNGDNQTTPYLLSNLGPVLIATDTSTTYYDVILSLYQLQNMRSNLAGNYALVNNIDASVTSSWNSGNGFAPVGNNATPFTGKFDGLDHVISNLTINRPTTDYVGLFGYAVGSNVSNLGLVNANVTGRDNVGALFGATVVGNATHNYVTGQVNGRFGVGGLIGYNNSMGLSSSYASSDVIGVNKVGGLMGETNGGIATTLNYASGNVTASGSYVGGLVGYNGFAFVITNSYATGNVSGVGAVGGLVGYHLNGVIDQSYATGSVTGTSDVGGLVGYTDTGSVTSSYWNSDTSGQLSSAGGTALTSAQMLQQANFAGWDFNNTWIGYDGHTNPLLRTLMIELTVTTNDATKTYDGLTYSGGNGVTYSTTPNGNLLGTLSYGGTAQGVKNAGSYTLAGSGLYSNQQGYIINYVNGALTVDKAVLTATATAANKIYDGNTSANATLSLTGLVGSETVNAINTATFNTKDVTSANLVTVGSVTLTNGSNGGLASNYSIATGQTTAANITAKSLTATAAATDKVYDGSTTASATLSGLTGLIGTETVTATGSATFNSKDVASANLVTVNNTTLTNGSNGGLASNYSLAGGQTVAANITAKALTATATAANKVYDGNSTANATLSSLTGLVGSEMVSATNTATFNSKDVAAANLVTINSATLADGSNGGLASNYSLASGQTVAANITAKALTATVSAPNKVYDGNTTASATMNGITGFIGTETITATGTAAFNSKDVASANLVTVSSIALADGSNGGVASNYSLASGQTVAANITAKALTATVTAANKVYDGNTTANATLGGLSGLIGSETVSASGTATFNSKDVATANLVTVNSTTLIDGSNGGLASNYGLASGQTVAATITAKSLTATVTAPNKIYDGNTTASATLTGLTGLVGSETVNASGTATFNSKDVATANLVTVNSIALADGTNGGLASNYNLASGQTVVANITAKALTASVTAPSKVYDGNATANATLSNLTGFVGTETISAAGSATFNSKDVATANLVTVNSTTLANGSNGGLASNYSLAGGQTVAANITAKSLTATASASNKVYDGDITASATLSGLTGLVGSETVNATGIATFNSKDVASANLVTVNGTTLTNGSNGGLASNYSLASGQTAAANVTPKALTATFTAANKVYDGNSAANATFSSLTGLIASETVDATSAATFNSKDTATANLVTVNNVTLTDGSNGGLASNYSLTSGQTTTANITPKALTVVGQVAMDKVYDGTTIATLVAGSLSGVIVGETVTLNAAGTFATANVGNDIVVAASDSLGGSAAVNYTLIQPTGLIADITAPAIYPNAVARASSAIPLVPSTPLLAPLNSLSPMGLGPHNLTGLNLTVITADALLPRMHCGAAETTSSSCGQVNLSSAQR